MKDLKDAFPHSTQEFHNRVTAALESLPEKKKEESFMEKRVLLKRGIIIAACVAVVTGAAAFARGNVASISGHSWAKDRYTSMPSAEQVKKDTGIENINLPEEFSNGCKFNSATVGHRTANDESGNVLKKYEDVSYRYKGEKGEFSVFAEQSDPEIHSSDESDLAETYKDCKLYYSSYTNKFVPPDYELTEDDKAKEASGELVFSYGSDEVEVLQVQNVTFDYDGKYMDILCMDSSLDKDAMLDIAKEIID